MKWFCKTLVCLYLLNPDVNADGISDNRAKVLQVLDGDTFVIQLNSRRERVRIAGVNAPEIRTAVGSTQTDAEEARLYLASLILKQEVLLIEDAIQGPRDDYNRLLAYVYRVKDGLFINAALIQFGYARVYREKLLTERPLFEELELQARRRKLGLWQ